MGKTQQCHNSLLSVFSIEMMLPLLLAMSGVFQDPYSAPIDVPQPIRLEMTPVIDGKIDKDEWDAFSPQTYLQWEPGKLYLAAQMPAGKDLVLSIDGKGDGWLVGRDNLEFRVSIKDAKPVVSVRELDATVVRAPIWRDRHDLETASTAAATTSGDQIIVEAVFDDAGLDILPRTPKTVMMRLDVVDAAADSAPYLPRSCAAIRFDEHRATALPRGMDSGIEARIRSVVPGDSLALRMDFHGSNALGTKSIDLRTLGEAEDSANRLSLVFPSFDKKGRAFVDYRSKIDPSAGIGYRIIRGTLTFRDGAPGVVEASYRIAPEIDFTMLRANIDRLPEDNILRLDYELQLYTLHSKDGVISIAVPGGWQVIKGDGAKFNLLGQTAEEHRFEVRVPADAHGTFPIKFTGQTKDRTTSQTCYLTIR